MKAWNLLVDREDLRLTQVQPADDPAQRSLAQGEVLLEIERFAITANNITYGMVGDAFGYWRFFPANGRLARIPVWGFARVVRSNAPRVAVGLRLFGYLPMSTHLVLEPQHNETTYLDVSAHRASLPATYNAYRPAPVTDLDDYQALLRPLLMTSFMLDDQLSEDVDVTTLVLTSASSKTALGLAWFARARGCRVLGLSSAANLPALEALGLYDEVLRYEAADQLRSDGPSALVDFAGNRAVVAQAHHALGANLTRSLIVGGTHWQTRGLAGAETPAGPKPTLFFAPDQIRKRTGEWGAAEIERRFTASLAAFVAANPWLNLVQHRGPDGLLGAFGAVLEGRTRPEDGHIVRPL